VTECQGCGAWNDTSRTFCVLCGTPLAEIDEWDAAAELPPLPPLPDGGLSASMPSWLREPPVPIIAETPPLGPIDSDVALEQAAVPAPLGPRADPRTFLSDDDFPQWLRDLAVRREGTPHRSAESASTSAPAETVPPVVWPPATAPLAAHGSESEPERDATPAQPAPAVAVVVRPPEERRGRNIWETLLLLLLLIGVIAAAMWALIANGVLSPGV
jgi:hypothetical protein